jgi:hypothetical protein
LEMDATRIVCGDSTSPFVETFNLGWVLHFPCEWLTGCCCRLPLLQQLVIDPAASRPGKRDEAAARHPSPQ